MSESRSGLPSPSDPRVIAGRQTHAAFGIGGWFGGAGKAKKRERDADQRLQEVQDKRTRAEKVRIIGGQLQQYASEFPQVYASYKRVLNALTTLKETKTGLLLKKKLSRREQNQLSEINGNIDRLTDELAGLSARFIVSFDEVPADYRSDIMATDGYKTLLVLMNRRKDCYASFLPGSGENTIAKLGIVISDEEK